jgi:hypothetical protein
MSVIMPKVAIILDLQPLEPDVPDWAKYIAIDRNGDVYAYSTRPFYVGYDVWTDKGRATLHYCDPPYPRSTRSSPGKQYRHEMTDTEHRDLAVVLHAAQGMVILSGYACDLYDVELYSDWHRVTRATHADGARKRAEVLWLSPATVERLNQLHIPFEA